MEVQEKESDKLRRDLTLFVKKMQLAGIDIVAIKKPTDAGTSIGNENLHTIHY
ncbi:MULTISPECIES: hypothetical protein [unclassified Sporosarcina]|uniref:hypothetical protein n=1 Tax=unclassified Sporosarcina TaxID=2647733 RepID=UPI0012F4BE83|nr:MULTISPECIES: hypothetical protein [unclassified Sporosarcina]